MCENAKSGMVNKNYPTFHLPQLCVPDPRPQGQDGAAQVGRSAAEEGEADREGGGGALAAGPGRRGRLAGGRRPSLPESRRAHLPHDVSTPLTMTTSGHGQSVTVNRLSL